MATKPSADVTLDDEAGSFAGDGGYIAVFSCVEMNADSTARVYSSAKGLLAQHGYSPGASYVASHVGETQKPVIFVGMPTATAGTIGRINSSGVTGSCAITASAGANGVLDEVDAIVDVTAGGTVGTDQIALSISLDGGLNFKNVRIGTATSYAIPYVGVTLNFGAGTLVVDDRYTFKTTAPRWNAAGITAARAALAAQQKQVRTILVIGDATALVDAQNVVDEVDLYETANKRFTLARLQLRDRLPQAEMSINPKRMTGNPSLTFAEVGATGDTITRATGSWITDGFVVGDTVTVTGTASNNVSGPITGVTATVLTFDTTDLVAEGPVAGASVTAYETLTFAEVGATGDTLTRNRGSWLSDGFRVGDTVTVTGTASNNVSGVVTAVTATVLTFYTTDLASEVIGATSSVSVVAGETMAAWISSLDTMFSSVDAKKRIDLGAGRAKKKCPITGYSFRRPVQWAASLREYQHDVHIATWWKALGPLDGWSLTDADGVVVEYDEDQDGGALAARFTCFRTWSNGPEGAFIAQSLTRAGDGSILSMTHNMQVANIVCTVVQAQTEMAIGQSLRLQKDGRATPAALSLIEKRVNKALQVSLLQNTQNEGERASSVVWRASRNDILNVPEPHLTGVAELLLNGTLVKISTSVRTQTAGA